MARKVEVLVDLPTEEEQRIQRIYCWVAIQADGGEGIPSITEPGGLTMPMLSSRKRVAERMEQQARRLADMSAGAGKPVRMELRVFDLSHVLRR